MKDAEDQMGKKCRLNSLSWSEVFEDQYILSQDHHDDDHGDEKPSFLKL